MLLLPLAASDRPKSPMCSARGLLAAARCGSSRPIATSLSRTPWGRPASQRARDGSAWPPVASWYSTIMTRFRPTSSDAALLVKAGSRRTVSAPQEYLVRLRDLLLPVGFAGGDRVLLHQRQQVLGPLLFDQRGERENRLP